jgi:hypothetical protein
MPSIRRSHEKLLIEANFRQACFNTATTSMTTPLDTSATLGPIRVIALLRKGQEAGYHSGHVVQSEPMQLSESPDRNSVNQMDQVSRLNASKLQAMCLMDPELERIASDAMRHLRAGRFNLETTKQSIYRFVIEPAAIELCAQRLANGIPWFKLFPTTVRQDVAKRLSEYVQANALEALKDEAIRQVPQSC